MFLTCFLIAPDVLPSLTEEILTCAGITLLGDRKKILFAIKKLPTSGPPKVPIQGEFGLADLR